MINSPITNRNDGDRVSVKEILEKMKEWYRIAWSKWIWILFCAICGGIIGFVYSKNKGVTFISKSTFVLDEGSGGGALGQYSSIASSIGVNLGGGQSDGLFQGNNIIELYKSRTMLKKALLTKISVSGDSSLLIDQYLKSYPLKNEANNFKITDPLHVTRSQDSVISLVINNINKTILKVGKPDKTSSVIEVEVKTGDEIFTKVFNDKIVSTVNEFYIQTKTKKALKNVAILQHQTDSVRDILNGSINRAALVLDQTPNLNPTRQALRTPVQRAQYNSETSKAMLSEFIKNLELSKISLRQETPLIQVIDSPTFPLEKERKLGPLTAGILGFLLFLTLSCVLFILIHSIKKSLL